MAKFRAAKSLELYGFASASRSRYKALRFAGKEGVLIELRGKSGRNLSMLSPYPRQREVLFAPWVKFRIKSVRREGALLHVTAEEVD